VGPRAIAVHDEVVKIGAIFVTGPYDQFTGAT
jgi:hypothetical protein